MSSTPRYTRRTALTTLAGAAGALTFADADAKEKDASTQASAASGTTKSKRPEQSRLGQSVCKWCYGGIPLDEFCREAKKIGLQSVELLGPNEWPTVKKHGLTCAVANGPGGIADGWNRIENHDRLVKGSEDLLPQVKAAGLPQMIVFSGNRRGLSDAEGLENCAKGLQRIMPMAEKLGVTIIMELLNSKRDHRDYQCDRTPWGVELVKRVGSERFKLLYDIYHMQIMEGDVIETIQKNIAHIGHFHTGGVPGRAEIDDTQELNYRRIATAIADTGFKGFIAQEFIPRRNPLASLRQGVEICWV